MANSAGMGLKRDEGFLVRFNKREMRMFKRFARDAELSLNDFARCKILGYSFSSVGGKPEPQKQSPKAKPTVDQSESAI